MPDPVPHELKIERMERLVEVTQRLARENNERRIGRVEEVLVEGRNQALGQWIGRTSQNRTLNFTHRDATAEPLSGKYLPVQVTRAGPNSLVGESMLQCGVM